MDVIKTDYNAIELTLSRSIENVVQIRKELSV
jgi:hypothetical protein